MATQTGAVLIISSTNASQAVSLTTIKLWDVVCSINMSRHPRNCLTVNFFLVKTISRQTNLHKWMKFVFLTKRENKWNSKSIQDFSLQCASRTLRTSALSALNTSHRHWRSLLISLSHIDQMENQYPFLKGRKGGYHLVYKDYIYRSNFRRQGVKKDIYYWECIHNRRNRCRGRVKTMGDTLYVTNSHGKHLGAQIWSV